MHSKLALGLLLALSSVTACAPVEVDDVDSSSAALTSGTPASQFQRERAALVTGNGFRCTATIIGPRHLLTAAHCKFREGATARFYTTSAEVNSGLSRTVTQVERASGVNPGSDDYTESDGDFADYSVLTLNGPIPTSSAAARMAWEYPGENTAGRRVGAGDQGSSSNPSGSLATNDDVIVSDTDNDGSFLTSYERTQDGDGGGAFYQRSNSRLLGVLSDSVHVTVPMPFPPFFNVLQRDKYSSVPEHLPTILRLMNYAGSFTVPAQCGIPSSHLDTFYTHSEDVCRYACEQTSNCRAYSWVDNHPLPSTGMCFLREFAAGQVASFPGTHCGVRP